MLTTAGPYFSTRPLKSGSAATGAAEVDGCVTGVGATGGVVAAVAECSATRSAIATPSAKAAAIASAIALRRKGFVCIVCSLKVDRGS